VMRKQRRSDGTVSVEGKRFEVPSRYRHLERIYVRYAQWDLSQVNMVDVQNDTLVSRLFPLDKAANASGLRRTLDASAKADAPVATPAGVAPLLKQLMADYAATGHPPAYIPKEESHA